MRHITGVRISTCGCASPRNSNLISRRRPCRECIVSLAASPITIRPEIRGTEAHLEKYRTFFERHPQILYTRLHRLGICYCLADDTRRARQILYRAIRQQPLAGKSYLALGLSLTGSDGVRMGYAAKHAIAVAVQRLLVRMGYTRLNSSSVTFEALCLLALSVQDQLTIIEFS